MRTTDASAIAKPPPMRKITPHGNLRCTIGQLRIVSSRAPVGGAKRIIIKVYPFHKMLIMINLKINAQMLYIDNILNCQALVHVTFVKRE